MRLWDGGGLENLKGRREETDLGFNSLEEEEKLLRANVSEAISEKALKQEKIKKKRTVFNVYCSSLYPFLINGSLSLLLFSVIFLISPLSTSLSSG